VSLFILWSIPPQAIGMSSCSIYFMLRHRRRLRTSVRSPPWAVGHGHGQLQLRAPGPVCLFSIIITVPLAVFIVVSFAPPAALRPMAWFSTPPKSRMYHVSRAPPFTLSRLYLPAGVLVSVWMPCDGLFSQILWVQLCFAYSAYFISYLYGVWL